MAYVIIDAGARLNWKWQRMGQVGLEPGYQNRERLWIPWLKWRTDEVQQQRYYPRPRSKLFRASRPGVYRFIELAVDGNAVAAYVGEGGDINVRLRDYVPRSRGPAAASPSTNVRVHDWILGAVVAGRVVLVEAAHEAWIQYDEGPRLDVDLASPASRRMIERVEESRLRGTGIKVINHPPSEELIVTASSADVAPNSGDTPPSQST